jgi:predicted RNase H-like nuclease (RuvC/YqgF family)
LPRSLEHRLRCETSSLRQERTNLWTAASLTELQIADLDSKSLAQQETLYNIEFQVQQMERKVARAGGKRTFDETIELNKKIAELQKQLDEANGQHDMLAAQVLELSTCISVSDELCR